MLASHVHNSRSRQLHAMSVTAGFVAGASCRPSTHISLLGTNRTAWTRGQRVVRRTAPLRHCQGAEAQQNYQTVRCFKSTGSGGGDSGRPGDGGDDEGILGSDPNSDENDGYETVVLNDPDTGRTLPCVVEHEVDVMEATYLVCCPQDDVVTFATENGDDGLVCLSDETLIDKLFATAAAVLAEDHVTLKRTAFLLTVDDSDAVVLGSTEFDEDDDDSDDDVEGGEWDGDDDEDDDDKDGDDSDDDSETVSVLGEFRHDDVNYFVLKPEDPVLLVARRTEGKLVVVEEDELEYVSPIIEAQIEELERDDSQ
jgi:hypothetical protein